MKIISLQKQLEYNKGCPSLISRTVSVDVEHHVYLLYKGLFMNRGLSNEAPEYISNLYTHTLPHAIPVLGTITLVCLGQG